MYVKCARVRSIMTLCTLCFGSYGIVYIVHNTVYMRVEHVHVRSV